MIRDGGLVAGNVTDKYRMRHPLARLLMRRFLRAVGNLYLEVRPFNLLEVGCGEGDLLAHLAALRPAECVGTDVSERILEEARRRHPTLRFERHDAAALGFPDSSFDLVVACEVLEHLSEPRRALSEIARVARGPVILSVPREPLWRALNLCRGAYLRHWGNTPGHLQHWGRRGFVRFVSEQLGVSRAVSVLPWTVILAQAPR
jgi:ubiquinone/menaquinone biosynthesis C-methylase UbiE